MGEGGGFVLILETSFWSQNDFFSKFPFWESKSGGFMLYALLAFFSKLNRPPYCFFVQSPVMR